MNNTKTKTKSYLFAAIGFLLTLALDQWTKYLASTILRRLESFSLISGVFELRYLENRGAAFGIMQNRQIVFVVGGIIILAVILYLYQKMPFTPHYRPLRICAVLLASGAVGNMIDRVKLDYVVDFFYFRLIDFPIFNVADCYVVIACILFVVLILFYYKDDNDFEFLNFKTDKTHNRKDSESLWKNFILMRILQGKGSINSLTGE